jgi:hypothetical protein
MGARKKEEHTLATAPRMNTARKTTSLVREDLLFGAVISLASMYGTCSRP